MPANGGNFNTAEVRHWREARPQNFKTFTTNYPASNIPIGINSMDIDRSWNARLKAFADNISPAESSFNKFRADFHLDAWGDTRLYSAGCSWLDVSKHSTDFQFGSFRIDKRLTNDEAVLDVKFEGQYGCAPEIVIWLSTIDISQSENFRVRAFASDVTTKGFKLRVNAWGNSTVHGNTTVSWIAVPSDRPNMTAGQFILEGSGPASKKVTFNKRFTHAPRILVALNKLDVSKDHNLRIRATAKDVTKDGMTLSIETWGDTGLYGAGVSWIAIEEFSPAV